MEDSEIFDLDDMMMGAMDDSFSVNDDDVLSILQRWKLTGHESGEGSTGVTQSIPTTQRFFDSRTFTRPKKKILQYPTDFSDPPGMSPQLGGLVSSTPFMQRSLINDVSPPSSLASSSVSYDCGNSLITSGDFSNISCLLNGAEDPFTRMNSFRRSRYAHRLADFDETKDNSIAKTDMHGIVSDSSGHSTLQNSVEGDATFLSKPVLARFDTFDASSSDQTCNETFVKPPNGVNETFELPQNATFDAGNANETFQTPPEEEFESPKLRRLKLTQSTPSVRDNMGIHVVEDLSPITSNPPVLRKSRIIPDEADKRMSLQNFEDVEKSISLLESSNGNIEEFEAILEEMTEFKKPLESEKLRQNLQNIKNRHSLTSHALVNLEKDRKTLDNESMSSSSGERLLRRSRLDDDLQVPPSEAPISRPEEEQRGPSEGRKNRDRFKTMRITKKHIEGMIVIDPEEMAQEQEPEFKKPAAVPFQARSLSKPRYFSALPQKRDQMRLNLGTTKASSIDHLDSNRMESQESLNTTVTVSKTKSNLKSPMGTKSKSYHNLTFSSQAPAAKPVARAARPSGLSVAPNSGSNTFKLQSKLQSGLRPVTAPQSQLRPVARTAPSTVNNNYALNKDSTRTFGSNSGLSRPSAGKSLVRPSSGYFNYNSNNRMKVPDSDTESGRYSPNSLSSSSASSRGSLYPPEPAKMPSSIEDVAREAPTKAPGSRIARPSGLKPPAVRSGLPRPTAFVKR